MRARNVAFAPFLALGMALAAANAPAAEWQGDAQHAQKLVQAKYSQAGVKTPDVTDTGRTFDAGGATWRVYQVKYDGTGFRHVAVTRQANGEYLAIEGLEAEKKWSHGIPLGR